MRRVFVVVAVPIFLYFAWRFASAPVDTLLVSVPDDAFYYLQIARHLAQTGRSTADGLSTTNGYHPLWMAIVTALAWVRPDGSTLLRAAVVTALGIHLLVALLVPRTIGSLAGSRLGWTAATAWLLNPLAWTIATQTVESMTYAIGLLVVLLLHLRIANRLGAGTEVRLRSAVTLGLALGLLILARTEGILVAGAAVVWLGVQVYRRAGAARAMATSLTAGATAAALVAPWLVFSWAQTGAITQDSGAMKVLWAEDLFRRTSSPIANLLVTAKFVVWDAVSRMLGLSPGSSAALVVVPVVLALAAMAAARSLPRAAPAIKRALWSLAVVVGVLVVVAGMTLTERQIWWLTLPTLAFMLMGFLLLRLLLDALGASQSIERRFSMSVTIVAVGLFLHSQLFPVALYPWQPYVRRSQATIEANLSADERVGSFNAGIPLYFGSGQAVALDGLVSHQARVAWTEHRLAAYVRGLHLKYIADEAESLGRAHPFMGEPLSLEELGRYPLPGWPSGERLLWQVRSP